MTELCDIGFKYATDKCPQVCHPYTPFYYKLFNERRLSIKKVFEMGIGSRKTMPRINRYQTGASLRMWRDFFPNAMVYGADIDPNMMFENERIKTFVCDEMNKDQVTDVIKQVGSDIDIFIDDARHRSAYQIFLCQTVMPLLKKDVIYVIEDVLYSRKLARNLSQYNSYCPYLEAKVQERHQKLFVVTNK